MNEGLKLIEAIQENNLIPSHERIIKRNQFLISEGEIEHHIYLVKEGAFRIFYISEFEEHTIRFGYENSIITSLSSFFTNFPSELYIQAIRKSTVYSIKKSDFKTFIEQDQKRLFQYNQLLEQLVVQQMEREIDLLTYSPTERYNRVMKRSPQLFQEIPLKYIAAYLRMTPETLSRIKKG